MSIKFIQTKATSLTYGISDVSTTIQLKNLLKLDGTSISASDVGDILYGTFGPGTSREEIFSITSANVTVESDGKISITSVVRGLKEVSPYDTGGYACDHPAGEVVVFGNNPQVYENLLSNAGDETVTGIKTFVSSPIVPTPTTDYQAATKKYIDDTAIAGSPKATNSVYGISKLSTAAVSGTEPIVVGDNDTRVPTQGENDALVGNNTDIAVGTGNKMVTQTGLQHNAEKYAADTSGSTTAYTVALSPIPTSLTAGMIVYAKIVGANTTTTPTLNVNSLGAKTIVNPDASALVVGQIGANSFNTFMYDGTNFVLQNLNTKLPAIDGSNLTNLLAYISEQDIPFIATTTTTYASQVKLASNTIGDELFIITLPYLFRLAKDTLTGQYYITHRATIAGGASYYHSATVIGNYLYVSYDDGGQKLHRFDKADLTNGTVMTISGTGTVYPISSFSDGTNLYLYSNTSSTFYKYTISGTTATYDSSIVYTSSGSASSSFSNGTNVWISDASSTGGDMTIRKYALAGGSALSTKIIKVYPDAYAQNSTVQFFLYKTGVLGYGYGYLNYDATTAKGAVCKLNAITLP